MAFVVIFRRLAQADLEAVVDSPGWSSPVAAFRWRLRLLQEVVSKLETDPHCYPQADEASELGFDLRMMLYGRRKQCYRILFTIEGDRVNVLRVRHAARDLLTDEELEPDPTDS